MANATITPPSGTQTSNFDVDVSFGTPINGLDKTDMNLRALTENGITGVDFSISGTQPIANFVLMFTLPSNAQGSFEISITGMVTPQGGSTPEAVMSNSVVVHYDTTGNVTATFGTINYRENGVVAIPITFSENIIVPPKTVFNVTHVSGDSLEGIRYVIRGKDDAYELVFTVPPDRVGRFQISGEGNVLKTSTSEFDNVTVAAPVVVAYNTSAPEIVDFDIPETYAFGENFDVRVAFRTVVSGWHANNSFTEIWIEEGARLGTPTPYKWTGATPSNLRSFLQEALPDDLTGTDWQPLSTPPAGHAGEWHGEEGEIFLMRIEVTNAEAIGIAQFTLRPNSSLRGPVA